MSSIIGVSLSLSSWQSSCVDGDTNARFAAELVTGVCCPRTEANLFGSCRVRAHCAKNEEALVVSYSNRSASVCCPSFSNATCHSPQQGVSSRVASAGTVSVLRDFCPVNEVLLRSADQSTPAGLSYVAELAVTSNSTQRWSYLTIVSNDSVLADLPAKCCRTTPVCTWSQPLSIFADATRTPQFWDCSNNVTFYCKAGYHAHGSDSNSMLQISQSSKVTPPDCIASRCSSLESQLNAEVIVGSLFDYTGQSTPLRCSSGLNFVDLNTSSVLISCLGNTTSGGLDWQPPPSSIQCPISSVETHATRKLLQYGTTSTKKVQHLFGDASIAHWFDDPYTVQLDWSMSGFDMVKYYNSCVPVEDRVSSADRLAWRLTYSHAWPNDGFVDEDRSEVVAYSGILPVQVHQNDYNSLESTFVVDRNKYVEGIRASVSLSIAKRNYMPERALYFKQLEGQKFLICVPALNSPACMGMNENDDLIAHQRFDENNPWFQWRIKGTDPNERLLQNIATMRCVSRLPIRSVNCADELVTFQTAISMVWNSEQRFDLCAALAWSGSSPFGWVDFLLLRIVRSNCGYSSEVVVHVLIPDERLVIADVGTFILTTPCGCDIITNPDGAPRNMAMHQRPGQKTDLYLSFTPQSLCNDEFELFEKVGADMVPLEVPHIDGYTFETYSSCKSSLVRTVSVEELTWDKTCRPRVFCLVPLPKPVCVTCLSQYVPGQTSPSITTCTEPMSPHFWFTVSGVVVTGGGREGASAPVSNVKVLLQVVPGNASVIDPGWSLAPLSETEVVTDDNGRFEVTISKAFAGGPKQFYQVTGLPVKSHSYIDMQPTILSNSQGSFKLVQVGIGAHMSVDLGLNETVESQTNTQILVTSTWICPDLTGNTTNYQTVACSQSNANSIRMTAEINIVNVTTTSIKYPNSQSMSEDSETLTEFHWYEWDLPWNISMLSNSLLQSTDPVIGQTVFLNDTEVSTPYVLDLRGFWLSPVSLANSAARLSYSIGSLVVPPTADDLELQCAPVCDEVTIESLMFTSGTSNKIIHSVEPVAPLNSKVISAKAAVISQSYPYDSSNAWFHIALEFGVSVSFRFSDILSINASLLQVQKDSPKVVNETDSAVPLVIRVRAVTVVEPYTVFEPTTKSRLRFNPSLPATIRLLNVSAVLVKDDVAQAWSASRIIPPASDTQVFPYVLPATFASR